MDTVQCDKSTLVGRTISHYLILDKLGSGGMGVVYKARDIKLDRPVALKFLPPHLSAHDETNARFVREAKAASALDHQNICTIYEINETEEGQLFIAMACYEGQTLEARVKRDALAVAEALDNATQLAEGLARAHEAGIVHRDIKPANVMVTNRGTVKILDFGLAKLVGSVDLTRTGTTMGTVPYMSPEQAKGESVDHRTDIWSFGVVLYEMLAGRRPFTGDSGAAVLYAIVNADPEPVTALQADVPARLEQVIAKTLAKNADERYRTMGEVLADLRAVARGDETISATLWQSPAGEAELAATVPAQAPRVNITRALTRAEAKDHASLLILLRRVRQFWIEGVLEHSVHGEALIALGKQTQPEAVEHPWEQVLELPDQESRTLPPGQAIGAVFDEAGRSLLILGAPGAGKTITLLELARDLAAPAEADPTQPIPVVFNLSSYADAPQGLHAWLAEELTVKYHVPKKTGRAWLEDNRLVLLLDGLDEVQAEHRAACVDAINAYVEEHGVPGLAICSRLEEYTALPVRLRLSGAIWLQPLSQRQVTAYVARSGEALSGLRSTLEQDAVLMTLAQTPLMLDVMTMAYRDVPAEALASETLRTEKPRRNHLFETYVERMLRRKGKAQRPWTKKQTLGWLTWLAQGMRRHGQAVFLIEQLQPSWLASQKQRWAYVLSSRVLGGLVIGLSIGLLYGLSTWWKEGQAAGLVAALPIGLLIGLVTGLPVGLIDGLRLRRRRRRASRTRVPKRWKAAIKVLIIGLTFGLFLAVSSLLTPVLFGWLIWGIRGARQGRKGDVHPVETLSWSWPHAFRGVALGLIPALTVGVFAGMSAGGLQFGLYLGLYLGLLFGPIGAVFDGLRLRIVEAKTVPNQGIKLSMRNAFLGGGIVVLSFGLGVVLSGTLSTMLSLYVRVAWSDVVSLVLFTGLLAALWFGGLDVIQHYTLRFLLSRQGHMPYRYAPFLDDAARLIFLKKVGGGYIFIHRLMLEHFATRRDAGEGSLRQTLPADPSRA